MDQEQCHEAMPGLQAKPSCVDLREGGYQRDSSGYLPDLPTSTEEQARRLDEGDSEPEGDVVHVGDVAPTGPVLTS